MDLKLDTFFYIVYKKKVMQLRKFLTSSFWWIYTFWEHDYTVHTECPSVCEWHKSCGRASANLEDRNSMKIYIWYIWLFGFSINWCWLYLNEYCSRSSDVVQMILLLLLLLLVYTPYNQKQWYTRIISE